MFIKLYRCQSSLMLLVLDLVVIEKKQDGRGRWKQVTIDTFVKEFESDKKTIKKIVHKSGGFVGRDGVIKFLSRRSVKRFEKNLRNTFVNYFTLLKINDEEDLKILYDGSESFIDTMVVFADIFLIVSIISIISCFISRA